MAKIELYTCEDGLELLSMESSFGAWKNNSESFAEGDNTKILVDDSDVVLNKFGDYEVINVKSVEIVLK